MGRWLMVRRSALVAVGAVSVVALLALGVAGWAIRDARQTRADLRTQRAIAQSLAGRVNDLESLLDGVPAWSPGDFNSRLRSTGDDVTNLSDDLAAVRGLVLTNTSDLDSITEYLTSVELIDPTMLTDLIDCVNANLDAINQRMQLQYCG